MRPVCVCVCSYFFPLQLLVREKDQGWMHGVSVTSTKVSS